ncbi:MAG TPA: zinc-binding dehydrogenase [Sedimentisphaerales bacterium]|nr:zinc-binding dehydrogenase [Sedimentisphaerales bacterium]HRS11545.1 zinc-binding dehydrogenase [Sedimentisphaerales bacterium]HRV48203.1 zinc-binding dehydrogenase [Sedimentisphaerales bacterium]
MKAAVIHENGELDVVHVEDVPEPSPGPGEVVLKVTCAGLNHLDIWVRKGRPGTSLSDTPRVLGSDAVGFVEEVGRGVEGVKVGDEVIVNPALSCGRCESCARGQQSECLSFGIVGLSRPGTFAERVVVPARNLWPKPAHLSAEEAGTLSLASVTAWRMLMTRAQVRPGESILIHGIGGGVALCAMQFAKLIGAEVIVTSSSDEKLALARELGADHTIHYRNQDVVKCVREITGGRGVDVAIDSVGAATWPVDFACVRRGGRIVTCAITTGPKAETNLQALYWNQLTILGSTMGSDEDFRQMLRAVAVNRLRPVIDEVFTLEEVRRAMAKMEAGRQFGKIALRIAP